MDISFWPQFWPQLWGTLIKDLSQWRRDRQAAFGPMLIPLVLMVIATLLFGAGGDEWNVALVVEGTGPEATKLAQTVESVEGNLGPLFRIITRDADEAAWLVEQGRLQMVITIPADFDARLSAKDAAAEEAAAKEAVIETQVFNINTDMMKNVRLRLDRAIQTYLADRGEAVVVIVQETTRPQDVFRRSFIAGGAVILALLVGAALNTAIMVAREWERSTVKEIRLAAGAAPALVLGKLGAGLAATAVNVALTLTVAVTLFGLRIPPDRWLPLLAIGGAVSVIAGGVGLAVGALAPDYRILQPLLLVTAAGSFFAAGGYGSVATLPPLVRILDSFWPPSYAFETMQQLMHAAVVADLSFAYFVLPPLVFLSVGLGGWLLRRALG